MNLVNQIDRHLALMNASWHREYTAPFRIGDLPVTLVRASWLTPECEALLRRQSQPKFFALLNMPGAE